MAIILGLPVNEEKASESLATTSAPELRLLSLQSWCKLLLLRSECYRREKKVSIGLTADNHRKFDYTQIFTPIKHVDSHKSLVFSTGRAKKSFAKRSRKYRASCDLYIVAVTPSCTQFFFIVLYQNFIYQRKAIMKIRLPPLLQHSAAK